MVMGMDDDGECISVGVKNISPSKWCLKECISALESWQYMDKYMITHKSTSLSNRI